MAKKVYELANELGVGALDLVEKLKSMGMNVRNHMVGLTDDEESKARAAYETPQKGGPVGSKKTVVKKVVKRVAAAATEATATEETAAPVENDATPEVTEPVVAATPVEASAPVVEGEDKPAKAVTLVKRKAKSQLEEEAVKAEAEKEEKVQARAHFEATGNHLPPKSSTTEKISNNQEKEKVYYQEKTHTFTPVFIPEEKKEEKKPAGDKPAPRKFESTGPRPMTAAQGPAGDSDDDDDKGKRRMGDLAAAMTKKVVGAVGVKKDLTMLRADEELRFASGLVGKTIYTAAKKKKIYSGPTQKTLITEVKDSKRVISLHGGATVGDLAQKLAVRFEQFQNKMLQMNLLVREDDYVGIKLAGEMAALYNYRVEDKAFNEDAVLNKDSNEDKSAFPLRSPIVTIMGHVDHGKTSLLDYIRKAKVASGEAGGITQHIGAYQVMVKGHPLTFLDTPGHAAFAAMRQRGADVTDVVVLVVAADDGVMPQTIESIKFCKNANKTVIVAVNKIDKPAANPDKVKQGLMDHGLIAEEWGGDTQFVNVSAHTGAGVDDLLEAIQIQAEVMELRENPKGSAEGIVIESKVELGRGPVATIIVQKGTLNKGDSIVVGETCGRARTLMDFTGKMLNSAGPSTPVQILGLDEVPSPGDTLNVVKNEREAKKIVENRINDRKQLASAEAAPKKLSLEDFFSQASANTQVGEKKILNLIVRSDVQGSYEAIRTAVEQLGNSEVGVNVIGGGVGAITDSDVMLASSSQGFIFGFNMRPVTSARKLAEDKGVDIKTYSIIYQLIDDVTLALEGMLTPEKIEKYIGRAQVRDTFNIPKVGVIAGTAVVDGKIERGCNIRLLRDGKIIYDGKLTTLKRFKDEVKEVKNGYECGMSLENFNDIKNDDVIEAYIMEEKRRSLSADLTL